MLLRRSYFCWERSAKASCVSLETPNLSATFSDVMLQNKHDTSQLRQKQPLTFQLGVIFQLFIDGNQQSDACQE